MVAEPVAVTVPIHISNRFVVPLPLLRTTGDQLATPPLVTVIISGVLVGTAVVRIITSPILYGESPKVVVVVDELVPLVCHSCTSDGFIFVSLDKTAVETDGGVALPLGVAPVSVNET